MDCPTDGYWDDIAGRYGCLLRCLVLLSGKHAARFQNGMNTAIQQKERGPYYVETFPNYLSRFIKVFGAAPHTGGGTVGPLCR